MKKQILVAGIAALAMSPFAQAEIGIYVTPKLGPSLVETSFSYAGSYRSGEIGSHDKSSPVLGVAAGYDFYRKFSVPFRVEVEVASIGTTEEKRYLARYNENIKTTLWGSTFFANAYLDVHNSSAFTPYVGLGVGTSYLAAKGRATNNIGEERFREEKTSSANFAWNVGVGGTWKFSNRFALDLGYRYANLGDVKTKRARNRRGSPVRDYWMETEDVKTHQFLFGARFNF